MTGINLGSFDDVLKTSNEMSNNESSYSPPIIPRPAAEHEKCSVEFTSKLLQIFLGNSPNTSFVISPYTIQTTFGMCFMGSESLTKKELADTIFASSISQGSYLTKLCKAASEIDSLVTVTRLHATHRAEFYPEYKKKVRAILSKKPNSWSMAEVDFETGDFNRLAESIDAFVDKKLGGVEMTDGALQPDGFIDANTRLLIVQAFCYTTKWRTPFLVTPAPLITEYNADLFFSSPGSQGVLVEYMQQQGAFHFYEDHNWKILRKSTSTENAAFYFVLPVECREISSIDFHLSEMINRFRGCSLEAVKVSLPKFSLKAPWHDLTDAMIQFGLRDSFKHMRANFCYMANVADLYNGFGVTKVIEKFSFELDEGIDEDMETDEPEETKPSTSTGQESAEGQTVASFVADHPFLFFLVYEDTSNMLVLLAGRFSGP